MASAKTLSKACRCIRLQRPQHDKRVERKRAMLVYHERVDIDRVDDVAKIVRQPAEIDQRAGDRVAIASLAAITFEQAAGARRLDHRQGAGAVEASRSERDVFDKFDPDAAKPEH